ncbi:aureobasidin resistance protein aur1 [Lichtheimia corymbifera JMRC:FSU:9682]|uniref:Aureobasidin resistance protein aur1 n=1 Tax=Lichtheimia corymbifera JMRC:FSU:9682 TaxID=1263082 RepID=A0A068S908_9FUNG|nr:aureobasidin resistance protein aur1 [Lichtheimia corymbifera JMRC:FSU:9682]
MSIAKPSMPRQWTWTHIGYAVMGVLLTFDLIIIQEPPLIVRLALGILLVSSTMIPYIRRFTIPAMPIFTWLITFYASRFIPQDYRPHHIFVNILPSLERILYGANLSEIISKNQHPVFDVLAWLPYGVIHFSLPFFFAAVLFVFGPPKSLPVYGQAFGYMNLAGVLTQLCFPNASPWYEMSYGSAPADYSVPGEAGGLERIDKILGLNLYGSSFGASPLVFGAFPSLHSGSATIEMCFLVYLFPRAWPIAIAYTMWMWWATMYLTHHYLIDLVGGSIYAFSAFFVARRHLPPLRAECRTRLQYLGIQKISVRDFIRSIEFRLNYDHIFSKPLQVVANDATMEECEEDVFVLKEPMALRLRRFDSGSDEEENVGLSYSGSSTPAEPSSPTTPRSPLSLPSSSQFPLQSKA